MIAGLITAIDAGLIVMVIEKLLKDKSKYTILQIIAFLIIIVVLIIVPITFYSYCTRDGPSSIPIGLDNSKDKKSNSNNIGYNLYSMGDYEGAISSFDEALKQDPNYALAWGNKGLALEKLGQKQEADKANSTARSLRVS